MPPNPFALAPWRIVYQRPPAAAMRPFPAVASASAHECEIPLGANAGRLSVGGHSHLICSAAEVLTASGEASRHFDTSVHPVALVEMALLLDGIKPEF